MKEVNYWKCEDFQKGSIVKPRIGSCLPSKCIMFEERKEKAMFEGVKLDEKVFKQLGVSKHKKEFRFKGKSYFPKLFFEIDSKLSWVAFAEPVSIHEDAPILKSHCFLILKPENVKDGFELIKIIDYEKEGSICLAKYVHNLQNFIKNNPDFGEIDFSPLLN